MRGISNLRNKYVAATVGALAFATLVFYAGAMRLTGNFHVILPGELYRSAQPTSCRSSDFVMVRTYFVSGSRCIRYRP